MIRVHPCAKTQVLSRKPIKPRNLVPVSSVSMKLDEIFIIQHSHTDIGFTHDLPIVWELQRRFLDQALDLAEAHADAPEGERFCWTAETSAVVRHWFEHATDAQIERFQGLETAGLIEVTALPFISKCIANMEEMDFGLGLAGQLAERYGLTIDAAMTSDVNGQNWGLVDLLLKHGVRGYSSAINIHYGRAPLRRPNAFLWEGPSGKSIPVFNGLHYGSSERLGMGDESFASLEQTWLPLLGQHLDAIGYDLPIFLLQSVSRFGDNGGPFLPTLEFVRRWNAAGKSPRLTFCTPRTWWQRLEAHQDRLPTVRGDWSDFWVHGVLSTARDLAAHRRTRVRLAQADTIARMLPAARQPASFARFREHAWLRHITWQEHTWTADCATEAPFTEDALAGNAFKANACYEAGAYAKLMRRDALDALAATASSAESPTDKTLLVVNPLPWERTIAGVLNTGVSNPRGIPGEQSTAHFQDRKDDLDPLDLMEVPEMPWKNYPDTFLRPITLPARSHRLIPKSDGFVSTRCEDLENTGVVENDFFRITYDPGEGGIRSLVTKSNEREWIDVNCPWRGHQWVRDELVPRGDRWARDDINHMDWGARSIETPDSWQRDFTMRRSGPGPVGSTRVVRSPIGLHVIQWLEIDGRAESLRQEIFLPDYADWVECRSRFRMPYVTEPQAHYMVFPFQIEDATPRVDIAGGVVVPGRDQIPGCCHDYFTTQNWVDLSNGDRGVTIALPENPLVQFGGFRFGEGATEFSMPHPWLMSWITGNFWHCNFPAAQPGWVRTRHRIRFHDGFDEASAHRFGLETAEDQPILHAIR